MQEKALEYYKQGYNCSQCILKAAEWAYKIPISKQCHAMCNGINNGFGIGGMCSVLIAGIMVFGLLFDEQTAKQKRICLLDEFQKKHGNMNCGSLKKDRNDGYYCEKLVYEIAGMIDRIVKDK